MKSSLMVKDDRMCTCQKGNQLKLKKRERSEVRRKRDVRIKKEIAACMSHHIPLPRSKLYAFVCLIPCMCMCGCMHVRFLHIYSLSVLTAVISSALSEISEL